MRSRPGRGVVGLATIGMVAAASTLVLTMPATAAGSTIYVRAAATGAGNGTSWTDAYTDLQTALSGAAAGDQIWVASGTYLTTNGTDQTVSFKLPDGVGVYGGFAGSETALSQRDPQHHVAILSGDIGTQGSAPDNANHVVDASAATAATVLDGFTITGGYNIADSIPGAGIMVEAGSPTLSNLVVSGDAAYYGAGIGIRSGGHPAVTNVVLSQNSGVSGVGIGSGVYVADSAPALTNVTFVGNAGLYGGGLYLVNATPTLTNLTFAGNTATNAGAAIYTDGTSEVTVRNSVLWDGGSSEAVAGGGTVAIDHAVVKGGCPAGITCTAVAASDPKLGSLADHGGLIPSVAPGSAAVDQGQNSTCATTDARGVARPQGGQCDLGAVEVNVTTLRSQRANDGWVLESRVTSEVGGTVNTTSTQLKVGDDSQGRQYRSILSFNTTFLSPNSRVVRAELQLHRESTVGVNPFTTLGALLVDLKAPSFGTATLSSSDFQEPAQHTGLASVRSTPVNGTFRAAFAPRAFDNTLSLRSTTQIRLRFKTGDNNNDRADVINFYSGDSTAARAPQLVVYWVP